MAPDSVSMDKLTIGSFNMHGFNNSWSYLKHLSELCDIIFVQEHWLYDCNLHYLDSINDKFMCYGKSSMTEKSCTWVKGRPHGGVAVLYRKSIGNVCTFFEADINGKVVSVK